MLHYSYTELTDFLNRKMASPLPGEAAQRRMASSVRDMRIVNKPNDKTRDGAVCMLLYPKEGVWHIPLIVRPEYDGTHSGQVAFPGGKVESEDADVIATALRETYEEIGVLVPATHALGLLTPLYVFASNFMVHPILAVLPDAPTLFPDPREVAQILEVPIAALLDDNRRGEKEISVRGFRVQAPFFDLEGQTVWGATAMMLSELVAILSEP